MLFRLCGESLPFQTPFGTRYHDLVCGVFVVNVNIWGVSVGTAINA